MIQKSAFFFSELGTAAVTSPTAAPEWRQFEEYEANIPSELTCLYWDHHKMPLHSACCNTKMLLCLGASQGGCGVRTQLTTVVLESKKLCCRGAGGLFWGQTHHLKRFSLLLALAYQYRVFTHVHHFKSRTLYFSLKSVRNSLWTSEEKHLSHILKTVSLYIAEICYWTSFLVMSIYREGLESQVV